LKYALQCTDTEMADSGVDNNGLTFALLYF
jgi:hypothetical protein